MSILFPTVDSVTKLFPQPTMDALAAEFAGNDGNDSTVPGPSAYEVAVVAGFVGTEAEWLVSLRGADSTVPGDSGASAYAVAVAGGFVGTEAEWLASLQGTDATVTAEAVALVLPARLSAETLAEAALAKLDANKLGAPSGAATLDESGKVPETQVPERLTETVLTATFVPRWAPLTAYQIGTKVVSPDGDVVTAWRTLDNMKAAFDQDDWEVSPTFAPKGGGFNFSGPFTSLLNEATGEGFVIKPTTDTRPAVFGWQHASPVGYVFHFEARAGSAAPAAFIGIGLDVAAPNGTLGMSGILIANKVRAQGIVLRNHETITHGDAFGFYGAQDSGIAALVSLHARRANSTTLLELVADVANTAAQKLAVFKTSGNHLAGDIDAATGTLRWIDPVDVRALTVRRDITLNNDTGTGSYAKLAITSTAANPAILELTADPANGSNAHLAYYRATGGGTYWASRMVANGQNLELQASPAAAKGSETFTPVIGIRNNSVGFFGTAPITKRVTTASATDLDTAITLVNALRADLIAYGLKA